MAGTLISKTQEPSQEDRGLPHTLISDSEVGNSNTDPWTPLAMVSQVRDLQKTMVPPTSSLIELISLQELIHETSIDELDEESWESTATMLKTLIHQQKYWTAQMIAAGILSEWTMSARIPSEWKYRVTKIRALAYLGNVRAPRRGYQDLEYMCQLLLMSEEEVGNDETFAACNTSALIIAYLLCTDSFLEMDFLAGSRLRPLEASTLWYMQRMMELALNNGPGKSLSPHLLMTCDYFLNRPRTIDATVDHEELVLYNLARELRHHMLLNGRIRARHTKYERPTHIICSEFEDYLLERNQSE